MLVWRSGLQRAWPIFGRMAWECFLRNSDKWRATKLRLGRGNRVVVPAARREVAPGSIAVASLVARWYARHLPLYAGGVLLDLGCGKAPFYELYAPHVSDVLCTDWPNSLHGRAYIDFASDLSTGIPLRDASVDTMVVSDVLEHVYRPQIVLNEMYRVLKPGGAVLMNVPFVYCVHEAPHDYFRYTQFAVSRMAEDAGFAIEVLDPLGGKFLAFADVAGKALQGATLLGGPQVARTVQRAALAASGYLPRSAKFPLEIATVLRRPLERSLAVAAQ